MRIHRGLVAKATTEGMKSLLEAELEGAQHDVELEFEESGESTGLETKALPWPNERNIEFFWSKTTEKLYDSEGIRFLEFESNDLTIQIKFLEPWEQLAYLDAEFYF